ncbi:hypothetical protein [Paragemmobacter straminiformis]|uniref:Uncharacterized protein n=1 Tax=Paragemmobacter straminiformis TaxID=2045119 RepID=A0A842I5J6_9RHOB|nr:hypothetical protein [Gemmobacter straminiformis]MBC2834693.1 hypothetical protein [Gemmobacter straminiformis]
MTASAPSLQPGTIFYDTFLGALRVFGTNLKEWSAAHGVDPTNAKLAATGGWNGPKARELRAQMIAEIGPDLFALLYRSRMTREQGRAA